MKNLFYIIMSTMLPLLTTAQIATPQFIIPIEGAYLKDYYLLNYVDWGNNDIQDYRCGRKTYAGHQGTDFIIRNFAQMDAGVDVYAADTGVVTYILDTLYDRSKTAIGGGLGNYVAIRHPNGFYTYYGHLKKGSTTVKVGDTVLAGQTIGLVGSSGISSDPHLHFEVWYDSLYNWDPFLGTCGNGVTLWLDTLPYINQYGTIDHDFTNIVPTLDTLKERLPGQQVFSPSDAAVTFWMQGYGVFPGDVAKLQWFDPEGNFWFQFDYVHKKEMWYYYWWSYINVPPVEKSGIWSIKFFINDDLKITDTFSVQGTSALTEPAIAMDVKVFQNAAGNLTLQFPEQTPFPDELYIVNMTGVRVYSGNVPANSQSITLPVSSLMPSGVYVLYSKHGYLKPCQFSFVR